MQFSEIFMILFRIEQTAVSPYNHAWNSLYESMFALSFSILIIKMERNEYVTRKNISTESYMIFFL